MKLTKTFPFFFFFFILVVASLSYFHPLLKGQKIPQSDITQFQGMVNEINNFREKNNAEPYWTGASFSGMPAYQISAYYPNDFVRSLDSLIRFLPRPADYTFLYFLSFFVLMLALKVEWKLGILGSLAFGFSTYLIIIFIPGHNAKAHAIGYMPLVLAGILWVFQKKYALGFLITTLAMALEIYANHIQMTYYLGFSLLILGIVEGIHAFKEKLFSQFLKQAAIILTAIFLGIGANAPRLLAMQEYAAYSTRGKSELTFNPDGSQKELTKGLDKDYITQYSYAKLETFNLFIPRFMGGGTVEKLDKDSQFYQLIEEKAGKKVADDYSKQVLTYWGDQPIVEAPAYIGAVIFFLFFLGIFIVKGRLKHWLVAATVFSILLSWGRNFSLLTNFFIDYVPLYDKFRAVSSIQIIAELCVPILGILALKNFFSTEISLDEKKNALKNALYSFGGLIVFGFLAAHFSGTFEGLRDENYKDLPGLIDAVVADRKALLFSDSIRSVFFMLLSATLLWLFLQNKLKQLFVFVVFGLLILIDQISVNKRYLNANDFVAARKVEKPFEASEADKLILQDKSHFRVANFSTNLMDDGATSFFHQSIGGYHAAKLRRYQELFDYQIARQNMQVLNMLNTKYFIIPDNNGFLQVQQNPEINCNAWFVASLKQATNATQEMKLLDSLNTKNEAVINVSKFPTFRNYNIQKDTTAFISLKKYEVTTLTYQSTSQKEQVAVFSEIFYDKGWNAYINGKLTPHFCVNYVLRGIKIPAGNSTIIFRFEPQVIQQGSLISISSYVLLLLISAGWFFYEKRKINKNV